jgi:MFS family permease
MGVVRLRPDVRPLLGASIGLFLVLLPLVQAGTAATGGSLLLARVGAVVALAGFAVWERRHRRRGRAPVIDLGLFRHRTYALGTSLGLLYFAGFTSIFFVLTLSGLGYTALQAGLTTTPFAVGGTLASAIGGRYVARVGRPLVAAGLLLSAVGLVVTDVLAVRVDAGSAGWALLAPLLVGGVGSGLVVSPNQTLTLAEVPVAGGGSAAGMLQTAQRVGSALGIAVVGAVFFAALRPGDQWGEALSAGLRVSIGFVVAALVLAVADLAVGRRRRARGSAD